MADIKVGDDVKVREAFYGTIDSKIPGPIKAIVSNAWGGFQRFGFWFTIAVLIGAYGGIVGCRTFYKDKMAEIVQTGAFLYDKKVYNITIK